MKKVRAEAMLNSMYFFLVTLLVCWLLEYLFGDLVISKGGYQITTYVFFTYEYVLSVPEISHYFLVLLIPVAVFSFLNIKGLYQSRPKHVHVQLALIAAFFGTFFGLFSISCTPLSIAGYDLMFGILAGLVLGVLCTICTDTPGGMVVSTTFGTVHYVFWSLFISSYKLEALSSAPGVAVTLLMVSALLCSLVPMVGACLESLFSLGVKIGKVTKIGTCGVAK